MKKVKKLPAGLSNPLQKTPEDELIQVGGIG